MKNLTFHGGIHPDDHKIISKDQPIKAVHAGEKMYYSVSQHIGAPAKPIVAKGDHVCRGQMIAEAGGFVSAPVYATVSGTVEGIVKKRMPAGNYADCIAVANDGAMEETPYETASIDDLTKEQIISRISAAGVVGMGGAGFPTHVKLSPREPEKIEYILVNGAECEPYLTSDYRRMLETPEKIVQGLQVIHKVFPAAKCYICIEDNKPDCIAMMQEKCKDADGIEVKILRTKYPQGAERMLIYAVTGRKVNSRMLPADVGCIVDNIDTVVAICQAVLYGEPLMNRIITVTGNGAAVPGNYYVPIGMLMSEVIEHVGGIKGQPEKIIAGGPMMGNAMFSLDIPVTKTSSAILILSRDEVSQMEPTACMNCGRCVQACPGGILPTRVADFADHGDEAQFLAFQGMECCECGCCSYVCPAKRHLTQSIRSMRKILLAKRKKG
ncbi:MAG: electron transport complex subunit RsxC [Lachnospiraceae bacterium]|nr:electron transport complex subunit RsxC [Lachnospiraceae bacterium]